METVKDMQDALISTADPRDTSAERCEIVALLSCDEERMLKSIRAATAFV